LGDPLLRVVSAPVASPEEAAAIFDDLRDTLHDFRRGISAVQIGEPKRLIYIELDGRAWRLRNPAFEHQSQDKFRLWDDCFSFPDLLVYVERATTVRVRYNDENGSVQLLEATGPFSELLQHEMDHLDGILAIDRAIGPNALRTREEHERQVGRTSRSASVWQGSGMPDPACRPAAKAPVSR
jgi:peptide deformylase